MSPAVHLIAKNLPGFFSLTTPTDLLPHFSYTLTPSQLPSIRTHNSNPGLRAALSIQEIPPNALRRKSDPQWRGGFSLGVDLGLSRTGIALSKGFTVRPLMVVELRGEKLELRLLEIAEDEEVDEFIIGIPKSWDGRETPQSNKVRSVAGRLAVRAADRGWRVYLQDEHGTSTEATERMIDMGLNKSTRQKKVDAYAAVMVLERYFSMSGEGTELVLPKQLDLQDKLRKGSAMVEVMASKGYPGSYKKGSVIQNLDEAENAAPTVKIFYAGTALDSDGNFIASECRVLRVTATGSDLEEARDRAYQAVDAVNWRGGFYRRDIGWKALPHKQMATKN